jgi:hypothetical protein
MPIPIAEIFRPNFEISESLSSDLSDKEPGNKFRAIINYEVIEKTKSFVILRINHVQLLNTKRKY